MTQISLVGLSIIEQSTELARQIALLPENEAIEVLNQVRLVLHEQSPFKHHPVDCVQWVPSDQVEGNDYNPNKMDPHAKKYLEKSILDNGYAMPVVVIEEISDGNEEKFIEDVKQIKRIVDGFHKSDIGKNSEAVRKQTRGYLPVCHIRPGRWALTDRMAATIQFNVHGEASIQGLSDMVLSFSRKGKSLEWIAKELGKEPDLVLRLMQQVGLAEVWKDTEFRQAWDMVELLPISRALKIFAAVGSIDCAEWEGHTFIVEQIAIDRYRLSIDGKEVMISGEQTSFTSVNEIEETIQQQIPSYQIGSSIWYEDQGDLDN